MTESDRTVEKAITTYCTELDAEAELASRDLAEIEDHLRALIDDLRGRGMPLGDAIAEAGRRLGAPRLVAREHARVRSPFGARIAPWRARSAAAIVAVLVVVGLVFDLPDGGVWSRFAFELGCGGVLAIALLARRGWARPILLGGLASGVAVMALSEWAFPQAISPWLVAQLGVVMFLAPWRRGELAPAGVALALQVWAYGVATFVLSFQVTTRGGPDLVAPAAQIALVAAMLATAGCVMRARWAAIASGLSAVTLGVALAQLAQLSFKFPALHPGGFRFGTLGLAASGALAAAVAAVVAWRGARSLLGSLRGVLAD
ncbi:MAG TPA: hypothetical protein VLX92_06500 [Kofleriaceae bacterium]|nr:hypothetical protein [Kofleriaceae bacterium]